MKDLLKRFLVTLVLAATLMVATPQPVQAQFGIVHDPVTLAAHIKEWAEKLREWVVTVEFYVRQVENAVETVTNLRGILTTAEKMIGFNHKMLQTISDIGKTIRTAFEVKALLTNLVYGRLRAIGRIHDRLANGLFNPEQIKQDLKDYFFYEIGQISERTANDIERLEQQDQQVQLMEVELTLQGKRIAEAQKSAQETEEKLREIEDDPEGVTQVDIQLMQLRSQQRDFEAQLARDRAQYLTLQRDYLIRKRRIAEDAIESRGFGQQITEINSAWSKMTEALNKMRTNPRTENPAQ